MFLRQRLAGLEEGWQELQRMWENRQHMLSQGLNLQMFLRDAKQAEVLLSHQENYLAKEEQPSGLEQAENVLKKHQDFLTTMDANDEKIKVGFLIPVRIRPPVVTNKRTTCTCV